MTADFLIRAGRVANCILCYYTIKLGRGVLLSFVLVFAVMLFRKLPLFQNCFQRMILWGLFLWLPFTGGLKFFFETRLGVRGFIWWAYWNYDHFVIGQVYFLVMALYGGYLFYRRRKLSRSIKKLERLKENIYICESAVTPFAAGLFSPKIVVPEVMARQYGEEELETILIHEKTHIRLGHLWCLFFWDVLRVLFWPNVFLTLCMGWLKADLEEMCDRVTIQKSGRSACDYGLLLLKCVRLLAPLSSGKEPAESAAFAGEAGGSGYEAMKRRILKIADFRQYRTGRIVFTLLSGLLFLGGGFLGIHNNSYARYTVLEDITVFDDTGCHIILEDSKRLRQAVSFDRHTVTVEVDKMQEMLEECGTQTEGIYIFFGGFMKQPGVGGGGNMVYTDLAELTGERLEIAYEDKPDVLTWIVKMM